MKKFTIQADWDSDAPHLDEKGKAVLRSSYLPHELGARTRGVPALGSGAIYPIAESDFVCEPFEFPLWYKHFFAMDVGWNRTAALWGAIDPESDTLYWYSCYYRSQAEPPIHAEAIKSRGAWIPGVIDPASRGRSQKDGEQLLVTYQKLGLNLIVANNAVEAGLLNVWTRKSTGRLKVFRTLSDYLAEHRLYRRDDKGKIVKEQDHLMDAERYGVMSGIDIGTPMPYLMWPKNASGLRGLPIRNHPKHQVEYNPMSAAWSPQPQQPVGQPMSSLWMPHGPAGSGR